MTLIVMYIFLLELIDPLMLSVEDTSTVFHVATGVEFQALKK
jgi:hypothetical protein